MKSFTTHKLVDSFGYKINNDLIHPDIEAAFNKLVKDILYSKFVDDGINPYDLGNYLQAIVKTAQEEVSRKMHWAEEYVSWESKKSSDLSWPETRKILVDYAKGETNV